MSQHYTKKLALQQQDGICLVTKTRGETMAQLLDRFRYESTIGHTEKITYAGRLDPMAEGVVLLLIGDARFKKNEFLKLSKTYETDIIFGISTDTLDGLGVLKEISHKKILEEDIRHALDMLPQQIMLSYPKYSSRKVMGRPLFVYAKKGADIPIPVYRARIFSKELMRSKIISGKSIVDEVVPVIQNVHGDFRQTEIIASWKRFQKNYAEEKFLCCTMRFCVSSGTYIRSLAEYLGVACGVPACAFTIKRTAFHNA